MIWITIPATHFDTKKLIFGCDRDGPIRRKLSYLLRRECTFTEVPPLNRRFSSQADVTNTNLTSIRLLCARRKSTFTLRPTRTATREEQRETRLRLDAFDDLPKPRWCHQPTQRRRAPRRKTWQATTFSKAPHLLTTSNKTKHSPAQQYRVRARTKFGPVEKQLHSLAGFLPH